MMWQQFFSFFATAPSGCEKQFLGLLPWYHYLPGPESGSASDFDGCSIKHFQFLGSNSDMPLVLLAVVDDLLRIAGLVAVGFVVYGAIQYIASQGSPDATARAQSTIINALIGLAVAIVSIAFVSFLGNRLRG